MPNRLVMQSKLPQARTVRSDSFPFQKKFGKTTNFEIPEWMFKRELLEYELLRRTKKNEL